MPKEIKDPFLQGIVGTKPIKKSNKNYKSVEHSTNIKTKLISKKNENEQENKKATKKKNIRSKDFRIEISSLNKKLKKGRILIDRKIDFHGLTVEQARLIFIKTINECFSSNKRCILFITGKGVGPAKDYYINKKLYYGKIRNNFLNWINEKEIVAKILSFNRAGPSHGGDGAFFVYLRKNKTRF